MANLGPAKNLGFDVAIEVSRPDRDDGLDTQKRLLGYAG
jgi:hypothetical protein